MTRNQPVRKAIIAAAGLGTRFLPQTKAMPKEMLPIVDRPVIQILVEQIAATGVQDIIIVTGATKRAIEDHFDRSIEFEETLRSKGKNNLADELKRIAELANFIYLRQKGVPPGNARPVLNAAHLINSEPFFYFFADDFFESEVPAAQQMLEAYNKTGQSVLALMKISSTDTDKYGIVKPGRQIDEATYSLEGVIEKPGTKLAPSNLASVHGFLFTSEVFAEIDEEAKTKRGEIEIQTAVNKLAKAGRVCGRVIDGKFHDAGNKARYLEAVVDVALQDKTLGPGFKEYLKKRLDQGTNSKNR